MIKSRVLKKMMGWFALIGMGKHLFPAGFLRHRSSRADSRWSELRDDLTECRPHRCRFHGA